MRAIRKNSQNGRRSQAAPKIPALSSKDQGIVLEIELNFAAIFDLPADYLIGQLIQDDLLHQTLQGARAVIRIETLPRQIPLGRRIDRDLYAMLLQALLDLAQLDLHDTLDVRPGERIEYVGLVDAVQELRPEALTQGLGHFALVIFGVLAFGAGRETHPAGGAQILAADVRGHDDDGVLEIHGLALGVREPPVIQDLQEKVEHLRVGLLDLVEEDQGIRPVADHFRELAALLVAHVARRRSDEARGRVPLHVFRHVDAHDGLLVVEHEFRQGLGELGLAHSGRSQEHEGAQGAVGVGKAGARPAQGVRHGPDGVLLADDPRGQDLFDLHQLLAFVLEHALNGYAGPSGHDGSHIFLIHGFLQEFRFFRAFFALFHAEMATVIGLVVLLGLGQFPVDYLRHPLQIAVPLRDLHLPAQVVHLLAELVQGLELYLLRVPAGAKLVILLLKALKLLVYLLQARVHPLLMLFGERLPLHLQTGDLLAHAAYLGRQTFRFQAPRRGRFVDQIHRLVRQEAVGDVTGTQIHRCDYGFIRNAQAVMYLIFLLETAQDGNGIIQGRLFDHDRLEAPLERGVLFDISLVLPDSGRADRVELPSRERGFKEVRRVHRAFRGARANDGMYLIYKEDYVPGRVLDLLYEGLQAVLELAAELGPGDQGAQIEHQQLLALQGLRHFARRHPLGQSLHDGGLAHPRLTDKHGIVLGPAGKYLDHPAELLFPADDRVELARAGLVGQIDGVFLEHLEFALGSLVRDAHRTPQLGKHADRPVPPQTGIGKDLLGRGRHFEDREQDMLAGNELILLLGGHFAGLIEHPHQLLGEIKLDHVAAGHDLGQLLYLPLRLLVQFGKVHPVLGQNRLDQRLLVLDEGQKQVHGPKLAVVLFRGALLGALERLLGFDGEPMKIGHGF